MVDDFGEQEVTNESDNKLSVSADNFMLSPLCKVAAGNYIVIKSEVKVLSLLITQSLNF